MKSSLHISSVYQNVLISFFSIGRHDISGIIKKFRLSGWVHLTFGLLDDTHIFTREYCIRKYRKESETLKNKGLKTEFKMGWLLKTFKGFDIKQFVVAMILIASL